MKRLIVSFLFLNLLAGASEAGILLTTGNPPGTPLTMSAGSTSGPMLVKITSDNTPNDIIAAWNMNLIIIPSAGAMGVLIFQDPATGTPANPSNYIFGSNGLGIAATNSTNELSANDFFDPAAGPGAIVAATPMANLLSMDFLASPTASGLFGIYAVEGTALTQWTDSDFNTQFFANVPNGTGTVHIGDVIIPVPEPASIFMLLGPLAAALAYVDRRGNGKRVAKVAATR